MAVFVAITLALTAAAPAAALPTFELPDVPRVDDVVATDSHLFLTADDAASITVIDEAGSITGTLATNGAPDLAVDGDHVWAIDPDASEAHRYDSGSGWPFDRTAFDLSPMTTPESIAVTDGRVWVVGSNALNPNLLIRLDPATGNVEEFGTDLDGTVIATHPVHSNQIWVGNRFAGRIDRWDVSSGMPVKEVSVNDASSVDWLPFSPDGSSVIVSRRFGVTLRDATSLELGEVEYRGVGRFPNAAAFAPDGETLVVLSPRIDHIVGGDLWVYDADTAELRFRYRMPLEGMVDARGTTFSADGDTLYVLQRGIGAEPMNLTVLPGALQLAQLDVEVSARVRYGDKVRVTTSLGSAPDTDNRVVRVYAHPAHGPRKLIAEREVGDAGTFTVPHVVTRNTTFIAEWDGDDSYLPLFVEDEVLVPAVVTGVLDGFRGSSGRFKLYRPGDKPVFIARVKPNHEGDPLVFELGRLSNGRWRALGRTTVELNARSAAGVRVGGLAAGVSYRVRARFRGDGVNLPDASPWSYFRFG